MTFAELCWQVMNDYRARMGLPPLKAAATQAGAICGSAIVSPAPVAAPDPDSALYHRLRKPSAQEDDDEQT